MSANEPLTVYLGSVDMDPVEEGFQGVLVEVHMNTSAEDGVVFVLEETVTRTGALLLRLSSSDPTVVAEQLAKDVPEWSNTADTLRALLGSEPRYL